MDSLQRLKDEYHRLRRKPIPSIGCTFGLPDENNYYRWRFTLIGPKDTLYEGGLFYLELIFPENYPQSAPQIRFLTPIYHLNISQYKHTLGIVYPNFLYYWNPSMILEDIITKLYYIFYIHNPNSPYCDERADEYKYNKSLYELKAKYFTKKYIDLSFSEIKNDNYGNWNFSCDENDLRTFIHEHKELKIKNYDPEKSIEIVFMFRKEEIKIMCQLKEKIENVFKKFLNKRPIKLNCEPLLIHNAAKLNLNMPVGFYNDSDIISITVIDISGVIFY